MTGQVTVMGDRVDRWLENALPQTEEDSGRQDMQLAILKEKLRTRQRARRNRRLRGGAVVVSLAVLGVFFGGVVDLGGDSFDLVDRDVPGQEERRDRTVESEFRGVGIGVPEEMPDKDIYELNQQIASGEGKIVGVWGWEHDGVTNWSIQYEHNINGKIKFSGQTPSETPSSSSRALVQFALEESEPFIEQIDAGELQPAGRFNKVIDGREYVIDYWIIHSPRLGEIKHYRGVPIR